MGSSRSSSSRRGARRALPLVAYTVEITDPSALGGRSHRGPGEGPERGRDQASAAEPPASAPEAAQKAELPEEVAKTPRRREALGTGAAPATPTVPEVPEPPPRPPPTSRTKHRSRRRRRQEAEPPSRASEDDASRSTEGRNRPAKPTPTPNRKPRRRPKRPKAAEPPKAAPNRARPPSSGQAAAGATRCGNEAPAKDVRGGAERGARTPAVELGGEQEGPVGRLRRRWQRGGGQLVGIEFLSYRQRVIDTITVALDERDPASGARRLVRFEIASGREVSDIRLARAPNKPRTTRR